MPLLRCPSCGSRGEVIGHDPQARIRCAQCGDRFVAADADSTREYNIFADDSPLFLPEPASEPARLAFSPKWTSWIGRFAKSQGIEEAELIRRALIAFAHRTGFSESPPAD